MPQAEIAIWGTALFLLAVVIAVLNDFTKKKAERPTVAQQVSSFWKFIRSLPFTAAIVCLLFLSFKYLGREGTWLLWFVGFPVLLVGFVAARIYWPRLKFFLKTGSLPQRVTLQDGKPATKCHQCAQPVFLRPGKKGDFAYECEHCGNKMPWEKDISEAELKQAFGIRDSQTPNA